MGQLDRDPCTAFKPYKHVIGEASLSAAAQYNELAWKREWCKWAITHKWFMFLVYIAFIILHSQKIHVWYFGCIQIHVHHNHRYQVTAPKDSSSRILCSRRHLKSSTKLNRNEQVHRKVLLRERTFISRNIMVLSLDNWD